MMASMGLMMLDTMIQHTEERLVEALDFHVQDSVNKALVKALHPFVQAMFNFGIRRFGAGSGNPTPVEVNINGPGRSSTYDPLEQFIDVILNDQEYEAFKSPKATPFQTTLNTSDESNSSDSDNKSTPDKTQGKHKCEIFMNSNMESYSVMSSTVVLFQFLCQEETMGWRHDYVGRCWFVFLILEIT
ncbi:hypothetical protein NDU88_002162 [Pleurodeles waltl]|uniref:Uncharacterized protein n=1 Tax=Pleurodeles waltl TaxID=8319 RepID=A0AAV7R9C1_PLEWA|nr:hypothetical protein NDU88_002162 [Pleurodeles waltl]